MMSLEIDSILSLDDHQDPMTKKKFMSRDHQVSREEPHHSYCGHRHHSLECHDTCCHHNDTQTCKKRISLSPSSSPQNSYRHQYHHTRPHHPHLSPPHHHHLSLIIVCFLIILHALSQDILVTCHPQESRHDDHDDMTSFQFNPDDFTDDILRVNSRTSEVSRVEEHHPQHRSSRVHDSVPSSSTSDEIMRRIGEERLVIPHPDDHPSDHNSDSTSSINHESGVGDLQPLKKKRKTATILMVHPDDLEFSDTSQGRVTETDQQDDVIFINHGGGAVSSVRRSFAVPTHFSPHVSSYPTSLFDDGGSKDKSSGGSVNSPVAERRMIEDPPEHHNDNQFNRNSPPVAPGIISSAEYNDDPNDDAGFGSGHLIEDIPRIFSRRAGQHDLISSSLNPSNGDGSSSLDRNDDHRILLNNPFDDRRPTHHNHQASGSSSSGSTAGGVGNFDDPNDSNSGRVGSSGGGGLAQPSTTPPSPLFQMPPNLNQHNQNNRHNQPPLDEVTSPLFNFNPLGPIANPFSPESFFNFFEGPFSRGAGVPPPPSSRSSFGNNGDNDGFQRRRLNHGVPDITHNSIGSTGGGSSLSSGGVNNNNNNNNQPGSYPSYTYYKGVDDESDSSLSSSMKWPKVFKFTDGRINLNDFEKDKKLGKVKFQKRDPLLESVRRDSFLILHGGTYNSR